MNLRRAKQAFIFSEPRRRSSLTCEDRKVVTSGLPCPGKNSSCGTLGAGAPEPILSLSQFLKSPLTPAECGNKNCCEEKKWSPPGRVACRAQKYLPTHRHIGAPNPAPRNCCEKKMVTPRGGYLADCGACCGCTEHQRPLGDAGTQPPAVLFRSRCLHLYASMARSILALDSPPRI